MTLERGIGRRVVAWVRERGLLWAGAHTTLYIFDKFFDFVLYPLAIIELDLFWGAAAMMTASLIICLVLLILYDRLAETRFRDLLGLESLKEAVTTASQSMRALRGMLARGTLARFIIKTSMFLYLSLWFDPMTCTIFMRPADHYGMSPKYWTLFALSVIVSNAIWALLVFFGVESVQALLGF